MLFLNIPYKSLTQLIRQAIVRHTQEQDKQQIITEINNADNKRNKKSK
jgi:hypothetical protein